MNSRENHGGSRCSERVAAKYSALNRKIGTTPLNVSVTFIKIEWNKPKDSEKG